MALSFQKLSQPRRALVVAALLVVGNLVLAGTLSASRRGIHLGQTVSPREWSIEFQLPVDWVMEKQTIEDTLRVDSPPADPVPKIILLHRSANPTGRPLNDVATRYLQVVLLLRSRSLDPRSTVAQRTLKIHERPAVSLEDSNNGLMVLAIDQGPDTYCFALLAPPPLSAREIALVHTMAESVTAR